MSRPPITPDLKLSKLLEAYPDLEAVLIEIAPAFKKLTNPLLRRTVAKVTSLHQAADVGGVSVGEMINRLRAAAGVQDDWREEDDSGAKSGDRPDWVDESRVVETFDAGALIASGGHPLGNVMAALPKLDSGQIYALISPFVPAPLIDKAREAGHKAWSRQDGPEKFTTFFTP